MPDIGFEAGVVLLFLLPGFISAKIVRLFCADFKRSEFEGITDALIHTFVVVVFYAAFVRQLPLHLNSWTQDKNVHFEVEVYRWRLILLLVIAVVWGTVVTVSKNKDWPWKWLREKGFTQRSSRGSVWHDVFSDFGHKAYVQVELKDDRYVHGYLRNYSQEAKDPCLFVTEASWVSVVDGEAVVTRIPGPGILLTKASEIVNVAFLDPIIRPDSNDAPFSILHSECDSSTTQASTGS
jgi:hypothetical protein